MVAALGLALVSRLLGDETPAPVELARRLHPVGAAAAAGALVLPPGGGAGALAAVWLAVCVCAGAGGLLAVLGLRRAAPPDGARPSSPLGTATVAAGLGYLTVGGAWLVVTCLDLRPLDLSRDIVRMTALHFHYAGFALPVLAATGLASVDWLASRVALVTGCVTAMVGPAIVAVGFAFDSAVGQVGGALVLTAAAWTVAFGTFLLSTSTSALTSVPVQGRGLAQAAGRALLVISSLSPIVPMVLAVQWALAQHTGLPALGIDEMASTHGVLNGIGFVLGGLAGWLLTGATASRPSEAQAAS